MCVCAHMCVYTCVYTLPLPPKEWFSKTNKTNRRKKKSFFIFANLFMLDIEDYFSLTMWAAEVIQWERP